MTLLAILLAVLLEQARPLPQHHFVRRAMQHWLQWLRHHLDADVPVQAGLIWSLAVVLPALCSYLIHALLLHLLGWFAALVWMVFVLHATLAFRPFKHFFTRASHALETGDYARAREVLLQQMFIHHHGEAQGRRLPQQAILPLTLKTAILLLHRNFFGVLSLFALLAWLGLGPAGAILFRSAEYVWGHWDESNALHPVEDRASAALQRVCRQLWRIVNWPPAYATGLLFAAAGNFEGALAAWRGMAEADPADLDARVLAAVAGSMNMPLHRRRSMAGWGSATRWEPDVGLPDATSGAMPPTPWPTADSADPAQHVQQLANLIWRALLLWLALLLMVGMIVLVA